MEFTEKGAAAVSHAVSENNRLIGFNDLEGVLAYHAEDSRFADFVKANVGLGTIGDWMVFSS